MLIPYGNQPLRLFAEEKIVIKIIFFYEEKIFLYIFIYDKGLRINQRILTCHHVFDYPANCLQPNCLHGGNMAGGNLSLCTHSQNASPIKKKKSASSFDWLTPFVAYFFFFFI